MESPSSPPRATAGDEVFAEGDREPPHRPGKARLRSVREMPATPDNAVSQPGVKS